MYSSHVDYEKDNARTLHFALSPFRALQDLLNGVTNTAPLYAENLAAQRDLAAIGDPIPDR